ncbi:MAG: NAD(P)-dependent oxidoreductase [Hasllibacter sp.]
MRIAVLGLGKMGLPMARRLVAAGFAVEAWNRSPGPAGALGAPATTPETTRADLIVTMLTDGAASAGVLSRLDAPGALVVNMASVRPSESRAEAAMLAARGMAHLDAPVSGGTTAAEDGTLAIMVGGAAGDLARAAPALAPLGRAVHVGPSGAGSLAKLANQAIVGIAIGAVAEATLLLERGGADPAAVRDALRGGFADSTVLRLHGARMQARDFAPRGAAAIQLKDLRNVLAEADALGLALPLVRDLAARFERLVADGHGDLDHSALFLDLLGAQT